MTERLSEHRASLCVSTATHICDGAHQQHRRETNMQANANPKPKPVPGEGVACVEPLTWFFCRPDPGVDPGTPEEPPAQEQSHHTGPQMNAVSVTTRKQPAQTESKHATKRGSEVRGQGSGLTAVAAPLGLVFGQSLHHVLDPPQLLLDLDVPLARRFRLRAHNGVNQRDAGGTPAGRWRDAGGASSPVGCPKPPAAPAG